MHAREWEGCRLSQDKAVSLQRACVQQRLSRVQGLLSITLCSMMSFPLFTVHAHADIVKAYGDVSAHTAQHSLMVTRQLTLQPFTHAARERRHCRKEAFSEASSCCGVWEGDQGGLQGREIEKE